MIPKENILTVLLIVFMVFMALIVSYPLEIQAEIDPIIGTSSTVLGDVNDDGIVDIQDYIILSNNFGTVEEVRKFYIADGDVVSPS